MSTAWDTIVIGAGPAGMMGATVLAEGGARILLIDEQAEPGGQVYRAVERNAGSPLVSLLGEDYAAGRALVTRFRASGAESAPSTNVWRVDPDGEVWTHSPAGMARHSTRTLLLAAGAIERPVPIEGWTLPGVTTIGALQILLKSAGLRPAGRTVLAGSGPLFYLFATQCVAAGVEDLALVDTSPAGNLRAALPFLPRALRGHGRGYLLKGARMLAALRKVRRYHHVHELRINGNERAESVEFTGDGERHTLPCDQVGLHEGVIPHQQVTRSLGCAHKWDETQQCFVPVRDEWGRSSIPSIFIAGDLGGIIGAAASEHDGAIAGLAILSDLGRLGVAQRDQRFAMEDKERKAHLTVRPYLDCLYQPRREVLDPPDPVLVCRCESVTAGAIRAVVEAGVRGPNQAKAFLRCGMGPCQGRLCGPTVSRIIAEKTGQTPAETGYYRIRSPLKPITVGELADEAAAT